MDQKRLRQMYHQAVLSHPTAPTELKHSLKSNERVPQFIDNLYIQIKQVQAMRLSQKKPPFEDSIIQGLVNDLTNMFIHNIKTIADHKMKSDLDKMLIKTKADYENDLNLTASGKPSGDFEEIIKSSDDSRDVI